MTRFGPATLLMSATLFAGVAACGPGEQFEKDMAAMRQDLAAQRTQQTALFARVERLETRLTRFGASAVHVPAPLQVDPLHVDPLDGLPIVRLAPARHTDGWNPAADAPPLDTRVNLREPTDEQLAALAKEPATNLNRSIERTDPAASTAFAEGVRLYNSGARLDAAQALIDVARTYPRHEVADNALYLAGLAHSIHLDCPKAESLLSEVVETYADGDAVAPAMLSLGHCASSQGRMSEARKWFERVKKEHPRTPESTQAEAALAELGRPRALGPDLQKPAPAFAGRELP